MEELRYISISCLSGHTWSPVNLYQVSPQVGTATAEAIYNDISPTFLCDIISLYIHHSTYIHKYLLYYYCTQYGYFHYNTLPDKCQDILNSILYFMWRYWSILLYRKIYYLKTLLSLNNRIWEFFVILWALTHYLIKNPNSKFVIWLDIRKVASTDHGIF